MDLTSPIPVPGDLDLKPDEATLVTVLRQRAVLNPGKKVFTFLANGVDEERSVTFGELDTAARYIASKITGLGLKGTNVLMFYPPGLDFIFAFLGCLYAGVVPVPLYPPRKNRSLQRIHSIASNCGARSILTTREISNSLERNFAENPFLRNLSWHATDTWPVTDVSAESPGGPGFEDLAFLQYTLGFDRRSQRGNGRSPQSHV